LKIHHFFRFIIEIKALDIFQYVWYAYYGLVAYYYYPQNKIMKTISLLHFGCVCQNKVGENPTTPSFFPRIIREFDDHDEPMIYGDCS